MRRTAAKIACGLMVIASTTLVEAQIDPIRAFYAVARARHSTDAECREYGGSVIPHDKYSSRVVVAQGFTTGNHTVSRLPLACVAFGEKLGGFWVMEKVALGLCCWPI
jgi:hypothetical protein